MTGDGGTGAELAELGESLSRPICRQRVSLRCAPAGPTGPKPAPDSLIGVGPPIGVRPRLHWPSQMPGGQPQGSWYDRLGHPHCESPDDLPGMSVSCLSQFRALAMISSRSSCLGRQPRTSRIRDESAYRAGGSPARRGPGQMTRFCPETLCTMSSTCRTEKPWP